MNTFIDVVKSAARSQLFFVALALLSSYLIVVLGSFPFTGFAIALALVSTTIFFHKASSSPFLQHLYGFSLFFCACIMWRSHEFLTLLNFGALFFLISLLALLPATNHSHIHKGFLDIFHSPWKAFLGTVKSQFRYKIMLPNKKILIEETNKDTLSKNLISLAISGGLLLVILPLLASANPVFADWLSQLAQLMSFRWIWEMLQQESIFVWLYRIFFACIFLFLIPRVATFAAQGNTTLSPERKHPFLLLLPKIAVSFVLAAFFVSQAQLYFASTETLQTLGYSHSELTREVFAQLTVVAFIVFALIYNDKNSKPFSRTLTYILFFEALFLTLIALKSVFDYSWTWGLTYKRLWGFTGVMWMFGALGSFVYNYFHRFDNSEFVKHILYLSFGTLIAINIFNFDYLIFHYSKSTTHNGIDYHYLSTLSSDSLSYKKQFETFDSMRLSLQEDALEIPLASTGSAALRVSKNIKYLQEKYENFDFRTFNLTEFLQYLQVRKIDTRYYDTFWRFEQKAIRRTP